MKAKFFESESVEVLEDDINAWLNNQTNLMINAIIQNIDPGENSGTARVIVSLWYSEVPPNPGGPGHKGNVLFIDPRDMRRYRG